MPLPPLVAPGPALTVDQLGRYSRHLLMPTIGDLGQRRLLAARVAVIGAGGLGSPALLYLAGAGVGHITVIDDDIVDTSNLQRQVLHATADVGQPKVDSALRRVRDLNPDVAVTGVRDRLVSDNAARLLDGHDLVLDGSDTFDTRYAVADACEELGTPLVWAAVYRTEAHVTVFWPGAELPQRPGRAATDSHDDAATGAPGLRDLFPTPPAPGSVPACGDAGVLGPLVGQVGAMMASEAIKLIIGVGEPLLGKVLFVDALVGAQREIPLVARTHRPPPRRQTPEPDDASTTQRISAEDLATRLSGVDAPFVLDVREDHEVATGVIPGARHIPVATLLSDATASQHLPAERDLVLVCRLGPRAHLAAQALRAKGFRHLLVLDGGMLAWPHPIPYLAENS